MSVSMREFSPIRMMKEEEKMVLALNHGELKVPRKPPFKTNSCKCAGGEMQVNFIHWNITCFLSNLRF
jgi:hypothetical protein